MSSFIQFESGWEKDKARQELREAREELLKRAEQNAKKRDERDLQKEFRGDNEWMLPSVSRKIDEMSADHKQKKEKRKKSKKSNKSKKPKKEKKKRKSKKRRYSSSSGSDSEYSSDDERGKRRKETDSSDSANGKNDEDEWVEKSVIEKANEKPLEREDWLGGLASISTFSKEPKKEKNNDKKGSIAYDPAKCARELNPYWKDGGEGLPKQFSKPKNDSDDDDYHYRGATKESERRSNWRKKAETSTSTTTASSKRSPKNPLTNRRSRSRSSTKSFGSDKSPERETLPPPPPDEGVTRQRDHFLTDHQMNELGAKLLKAEMLGNDELVKELKEKLDKAREYRSTKKAEILSKTYERRNDQHKRADKSKEDVLLTATNSKGYSRPVTKPNNDSDLWGGRSGRKAKKSKPVETHMDGERVRYFADDDKYNIKDMFEAEKFTSAADQDMQFANIIGKHKNPNDNLDELFADKIRKNIADDHSDQRERAQAMKEHHNLQKTLDNCERCFDSSIFEKQLIVAMGKNVYLALPSYEGMQMGHCVIAPFSHVPCATQLDDDVWREMRDFMKSIERMFQARKQDVIFFETARYLHRRPHMQIHCIPNKDFEMAPFHFKKAIQESEDDWATNKQLISLKDRDVRRAIPKGLPYFWVNFGMASGFAHVIENQEKFPGNFAQEIIGGLLELDPRLWRRPRKLQNPIPKVKQFADWYKSYDITQSE